MIDQSVSQKPERVAAVELLCYIGNTTTACVGDTMSSRSVRRSAKASKASTTSSTSSTLERWLERMQKASISRRGATRLIMNYLVTECFKETAEKLKKESGLPLTPGSGDASALLDKRTQIRDAIHEGRIREARQLVDQLHPRLLETDRQLLFGLQKQQMIELIRESRIEDALKMAQRELAPHVQESSARRADIERTLALLAFNNPATSPLGDLLHVSHRQKLASEVNAAILKMNGAQSAMPPLLFALHTLNWAEDQLDNKQATGYAKMTDIAEAAATTSRTTKYSPTSEHTK